MKPERFIGKTLGELAEQAGVFLKPIRVFVLDDAADDIGKLLISAYTLRQIIFAFPAMSTATVMQAYNFYGETILRILA